MLIPLPNDIRDIDKIAVVNLADRLNEDQAGFMNTETHKFSSMRLNIRDS